MTQSSSTGSTSTPENTCTVTNNLIVPFPSGTTSTSAQNGWNGDIVVISGYNNSSTSTGQDYLQTSLTLLSFLEQGQTESTLSASQSSSLPMGDTGTLNLLPYYVPGSSTEVNSAYNLLISQANNYFPVAPIGEVKLGTKFEPITVPQGAPCNSSSAANAYIFLQNMMAYPSSPLAQQFTAAINADNSSNPPTSSSSNVNAFFAGTTDFQNVTFAIYSAVTSYALAYATIWANFQSSYTYNFYTTTPSSSNSSSATGSSNVTVDVKVSSLGSVVFSQSGTQPPSLTDANAGYAITWQPVGGPEIPLTFVNGQLVADNADGFSSICLQCTFMDLAALTGNAADSGQTIQALTGVIDGSNSIGSPVSLKQSVGEDINEGLHEVMTSTAFEALEVGLALYQGIEVMVKLGCWLKAKVTKGETPTEAEVKTTETDMQTEAQDKLEQAGNDETVETGSDLTTAQAQAEDTTLNAEGEAAEGAELDNQLSEEEGELALENNAEIDTEIDTTDTDISELEQINPESPDASESIESMQSDISSNQETIETENQELGDASSTEVQQQDDTFEQEETDEANDEAKEDDDDDADADAGDDLGDVAADL